MSVEANGPEFENRGNEPENGFFERIRQSKTARNTLVGVVALSAVGVGTKGYFNASHESKTEVAQLSDRLEAGALESYGEPGGIDVFDHNVILTEGAKFYDAPHEVEDQRFFGLVRNSNIVETLGSDEVRSAEAVLTINGEGDRTWVGVRVESNGFGLADEADEELSTEEGEQDASETGDPNIAQFALSELIWTPVDVSDETGLPTAYYANTDEAVTETVVDTISVSADVVTAIGSNASQLAKAEDLSLPFEDVLAFNNAFYGEGITGSFLPMNMAELPNTAQSYSPSS